MKNLSSIILIVLLISCVNKKSDCDERSTPYWTIAQSGKPHNTRIEGENFTLRKAFQDLVESESSIEPQDGFITLRLHLDKYGNFCGQENFQINSNYQTTQFNNGELIRKLENISSQLEGWLNDTESKTYYLIRLKIKNGRIAEIF